MFVKIKQRHELRAHFLKDDAVVYLAVDYLRKVYLVLFRISELFLRTSKLPDVLRQFFLDAAALFKLVCPLQPVVDLFEELVDAVAVLVDQYLVQRQFGLSDFIETQQHGLEDLVEIYLRQDFGPVGNDQQVPALENGVVPFALPYEFEYVADIEPLLLHDFILPLDFAHNAHQVK